MANYSEYDLNRWEVKRQAQAQKDKIIRYLMVTSYFRINTHPSIALAPLPLREEARRWYKDHEAMLQNLKELQRVKKLNDK